MSKSSEILSELSNYEHRAPSVERVEKRADRQVWAAPYQLPNPQRPAPSSVSAADASRISVARVTVQACTAAAEVKVWVVGPVWGQVWEEEV